MSITHVFLTFTLATYTLSLPLTKNSQTVEVSSVVEDDLVQVYTPVDPLVNLDLLKSHKFVQRVRRAPRSGGIINGGACPDGEWQLPNGQCAPCQGQNTPECAGVTEKDYYDDIVP